MMDRAGEWDFWGTAGLRCAGYNEQIDKDALAVLRGIAEKKYCSDIAKDLRLPESYVELLQSIFCSMGWCEYGTSPRGCWVVHDLKADDLIAKMEAYIQWRWVDEQEGACQH